MVNGGGDGSSEGIEGALRVADSGAEEHAQESEEADGLPHQHAGGGEGEDKGGQGEGEADVVGKSGACQPERGGPSGGEGPDPHNHRGGAQVLLPSSAGITRRARNGRGCFHAQVMKANHGSLAGRPAV